MLRAVGILPKDHDAWYGFWAILSPADFLAERKCCEFARRHNVRHFLFHAIDCDA
jgi:hypothetical protein